MLFTSAILKYKIWTLEDPPKVYRSFFTTIKIRCLNLHSCLLEIKLATLIGWWRNWQGYSCIALIGWEKSQSYWLKQDPGTWSRLAGRAEHSAVGKFRADPSPQAPCRHGCWVLLFNLSLVSHQASFSVGIFFLSVHRTPLSVCVSYLLVRTPAIERQNWYEEIYFFSS